MSTALQNTVTRQASDEQLDIYRRNFAPKSTPEEWGIFVQTCKAYGLNPLRREIYLVSRWSKESGGYKATPQVSIGGLLAMADATGQFKGLTRPIYIDEEGNEYKRWLTRKGKTPYPYAIEIGVYRAGFVEPVTVVCYFHEVAQTTKENKLTQFWERMGIHMHEKCAIAKGLRLTFSQLSGIYIDDEMKVADMEAARVNITPEPEPTKPRNTSEQIKYTPVVESTPAAPVVEAASPAPTTDEKPATQEHIPTEKELIDAMKQAGYSSMKPAIEGLCSGTNKDPDKILRYYNNNGFTPDLVSFLYNRIQEKLAQTA
jgi:phage recombination protein Bet